MRSLVIPALIFATAALAQVPPKPEPMEIPATPIPSPDGMELRALPPPGTPLAVAAPVFVRSFRIVGATTFETELAALLAPWTGRELSTEDFAKASQAATTHLRGKGLLVAQAFVPTQQVRDGVVEMRIYEGRIGAMHLAVAEDSRLRRSMAERFVSDLKPGETIRRDNLENDLLLLNDLPGVRLSASLAPGADAGTADIHARLQDEGGPVSGRLTLDNAGLLGAGEYRAGLDLRVPSPLGFGDLFTARLLYAGHGGELAQGVVTYGVPVNGMGTRVGLRYGEQRYRLGAEFELLHANGTSRATSFLASHPLRRRADHNLFAGYSYTQFEFNDRIDAVGSVTDSRHKVSLFSLTGDERDTWLGGGVGYAQVQYMRGNVILDTPAVAAADAAPGGLGVAGNFSVYRMQLQRAQTLDRRSSLIAQLRGQIASKNLDAGPEIAVGGPDAVRAYPVGELYADDGLLARFEYRWRYAAFGTPAALSLFYDAMRVKVNHDPLPGDPRNNRDFAGYGFGAYFAPYRSVALQTWLAWRAGTDKPQTSEDRSPRIWAALTVQF